MRVVLAIVCVSVIYLIYNFIYRKFWSKNLSVELNFEKEFCACGEENELIEVVSNAKFLPISILRVRFYVSKHLDFGDKQNVSVSDKSYKNDIFSVMFFQRITRRIGFVCRRRGFYNIDKIEIVSYNLFMRSPLTGTRECNTSLTVFPKSLSSKKLDVVYSSIYGDVVLKRAQLTDPFEFKGIREYESFDSIRDINWNASARSEELMVNVHGYTSSQQVTLILNVLGDNEFIDDRIIETAISIAQGLCVRLIKNGIPVSFYTNGRDCVNGGEIALNSAAGEGHIKALKCALARCDVKNANSIESLIEKIPRKKDTVYAVVSCASKKEVFESAKKLGGVGSEVTFVNVYKKGEERRKASEAGIRVINWETEGL